jgi:hypothetical protein
MLVYGLRDPLTRELRYVGMSRKGLSRARDHFKPCMVQKDYAKHNRHKAAWIKRLLDGGLKPEPFVIEALGSVEELREAEQFWIAYFRAIGSRLTNKTKGGEGVFGYRFSDLQRKMISERTKAAMKSPEVRAKLTVAVPGRGKPKGWKATAETRAKMSESAKKRKPSFEGRKHSQETKDKISATKREAAKCNLLRSA